MIDSEDLIQRVTNASDNSFTEAERIIILLLAEIRDGIACIISSNDDTMDDVTEEKEIGN